MILCRAQYAEALDKAVFPGLQGGPHNSTTAAIAVALKEATSEEFKRYAQQIVANAQTLAAALSARGFALSSGGTDNHLILMDMTNKGVTGYVMAKALDAAGIVCNFNRVPFDPRPARKPAASVSARRRLPAGALVPRRWSSWPSGWIGWLRSGLIKHWNSTIGKRSTPRWAAEVRALCARFRHLDYFTMAGEGRFNLRREGNHKGCPY